MVNAKYQLPRGRLRRQLRQGQRGRHLRRTTRPMVIVDRDDGSIDVIEGSAGDRHVHGPAVAAPTDGRRDRQGRRGQDAHDLRPHRAVPGAGDGRNGDGPATTHHADVHAGQLEHAADVIVRAINDDCPRRQRHPGVRPRPADRQQDPRPADHRGCRRGRLAQPAGAADAAARAEHPGARRQRRRASPPAAAPARSKR